MSQLSEFYNAKNVFITGATGCIGKILLEKLLRTCPGIGNVYIMIRAKKGMSPAERIRAYSEMAIFQYVQKEIAQKMIIVEGDLNSPELALSLSDQDILIREVNVVFHCAATVRFDQSLKESIQINVIGTKSLLELCRKFENLKSVVHVSTAYSNCIESYIKEKVYDTRIPYQKVIDIVNWFNPKVIDSLTNDFVQPHPNTYTFTKAITECLIRDEFRDLPIAIVRPCIVTCVWKEPISGYTPNASGVNGVLIAGSTGLLRTMCGNGNLLADIIPVDIVINWIVSIGWYTAVYRPDLKVYNCTAGPEKRQKWQSIITSATNSMLKYPHHRVLRYPGGSLKTNMFKNTVVVYLNHLLPGIVVDTIFRLMSKKPFMLKFYKKIHQTTGSFAFFTFRQWSFQMDSIGDIQEKMNKEDKAIFYMDLKDLVWDDYWKNNIISNRKYIFNEEMCTLPSARRTLFLRYWVTTIPQVGLSILMSYFLLNLFPEVKEQVKDILQTVGAKLWSLIF